MTIYIDIVIIENFIMNYIILYATATVMKIKISHIRIAISSLLGAIYSIIAYLGISKIYSNIFLKLLLSVVIIYVSFNPQSFKKMWKNIIVFYLISFVFGGVAFALIYVVKPQNILMEKGIFIGTYPLKTIVLSAIISFIIVLIAFKVVRGRRNKKDLLCDIEIKVNNSLIRTKAFIDTGNCLKEPITNIPVVVIEHTLLNNCLPIEILNNLEKIMGGDFANISSDIKKEYIYKLKLIPYSSLGKQNGMLLGIKPEWFKVISDEEERKIDVIIGIYNKELTKNGEYRALMGKYYDF